jgi:uncharacterized damage-inducible protein DinB
MNQVERIACELKQSFAGSVWHGQSVGELLSGVTATEAAAKPIAGAHSIHEIVLHLITWVTLATRALNGQRIPKWPFPEDWPPTAGTPWEDSVERLKQATEELSALARHLTDSQLETQAPGRTYTYGALLLGIVQHAAYHGGQIALLKKRARV